MSRTFYLGKRTPSVSNNRRDTAQPLALRQSTRLEAEICQPIMDVTLTVAANGKPSIERDFDHPAFQFSSQRLPLFIGCFARNRNRFVQMNFAEREWLRNLERIPAFQLPFAADFGRNRDDCRSRYLRE